MSRLLAAPASAALLLGLAFAVPADAGQQDRSGVLNVDSYDISAQQRVRERRDVRQRVNRRERRVERRANRRSARAERRADRRTARRMDRRADRRMARRIDRRADRRIARRSFRDRDRVSVRVGFGPGYGPYHPFLGYRSAAWPGYQPYYPWDYPLYAATTLPLLPFAALGAFAQAAPPPAPATGPVVSARY